MGNLALLEKALDPPQVLLSLQAYIKILKSPARFGLDLHRTKGLRDLLYILGDMIQELWGSNAPRVEAKPH